MEASRYYKVTECGRLARVSTPYKMDSRTKKGVGFDSISQGYMKFYHRHEKGGRRFSILTHRMVYYLHYGELPEIVDHLDRDTGNNHPSNLRSATHSQNCMNSRSAKNSSSKYLGVSWVKATSKWRAMISANGNNQNLGSFRNEVEAAQAYDQAATKHHGEFANLNFK